METDFTRPGSTSQQGDLRDIQEILARDRRRISSNTVKMNTKESTTQSRDRETTAGRITTDIRHRSKYNNCSLQKKANETAGKRTRNSIKLVLNLNVLLIEIQDMSEQLHNKIYWRTTFRKTT